MLTVFQAADQAQGILTSSSAAMVVNCQMIDAR